MEAPILANRPMILHEAVEVAPEMSVYSLEAAFGRLEYFEILTDVGGHQFGGTEITGFPNYTGENEGLNDPYFR